MTGELEDELARLYGQGDPFAPSPTPPAGYHQGYQAYYKPTMTPADLALGLVPPGSRAGYASPRDMRANHWRPPSQFELAITFIPGLMGTRVPSPSRWFHGTSDPSLRGFSPEIVGGLRNTGGRGAVFLTPSSSEAATYGKHILPVESRHINPFIWDIGDMRATSGRARDVLPNLRTHGDTWLDQAAFFDALKRRGHDSIETHWSGRPIELGVFDPRVLRVIE